METANPLTVGEQIRIARTRARLEQGPLAERVGVSQSTISNWERGIHEPTISEWVAIAEATGATWLLRLDGGDSGEATRRESFAQLGLFDSPILNITAPRRHATSSVLAA